MNHQHSKRRQMTRRVLINTLMSVSVIVIVSVLMLVILGYSFNQKDQRIEQGGLLQFASTPSGAVVTLDEATLGSHTPSKITAAAQTHTVTMKLKGYRIWQKTINLQAGEIGWLNYARLIPTTLTSQKLHEYPTMAGALASTADKWMALLPDGTKPIITIADLQNDTVTYKVLELPVASYTQAADIASQSFSLDSWSNDERYVLVKHTYDGKIEWLVVDRDDVTKTKNVSTLLGFSSDKVIFATKDGRTLYERADGVVRKINLDSETLSRPLVSNIDDFSVFDFSTLLYTTKADPSSKLRSVGYMTNDMQYGLGLASFPDDGMPLRIAMKDYFGKRYLAIAHGAIVSVTAGTLPHATDKGDMNAVTVMMLPSNIEWLSISASGRFIIAQSANAYTVRDQELDKTDTTTLKGTTVATTQLRWIDQYMTWTDRDGMLHTYEFDGTNQQDIIPVSPGFDVAISSNDKYLYSIGHDSVGYHLQRTQLVLQ